MSSIKTVKLYICIMSPFLPYLIDIRRDCLTQTYKIFKEELGRVQI